MDVRLTPHHTELLRGFADALDRAARNTDGGVRTFSNSHESDYQLAHTGTLTYVADAIRAALDADTSGGPTNPQQAAERAATATGRHALQDFLDQIHQPGVSSAVVMYASKNTGGQGICTTTATALQNLLDDANLSPAAVADEPEPDRMPAPTAMTTSDQLRHALIDHLDAGTPADATVYIAPTDHPLDNGLTIPFGTLVDALADAAGDVHLRPTTKPTNTDLPAGLGTDPDPYGIDLRGPHTTIRSADRATLGGLADLDPRDRALYRALLRTTLDNLDRTEPTQTVIRAGNR